MVQFLEKSDAFPVQKARCGIIFLFSRQTSQISERTSNAPTVTEFTKKCQPLFVQCPRGRGVALIASDVSLVVQGPGDACAIPHSLEDGETLGRYRARWALVT